MTCGEGARQRVQEQQQQQQQQRQQQQRQQQQQQQQQRQQQHCRSGAHAWRPQRRRACPAAGQPRGREVGK